MIIYIFPWAFCKKVHRNPAPRAVSAPRKSGISVVWGLSFVEIPRGTLFCSRLWQPAFRPTFGRPCVIVSPPDQTARAAGRWRQKRPKTDQRALREAGNKPLPAIHDLSKNRRLFLAVHTILYRFIRYGLCKESFHATICPYLFNK